MKDAKRKKLEEAGWRVGSPGEFLGLSEEEEVLVAMKLALARNIKTRRHELKLTQQQVAKRIGSSQSRVAKMEVGDASVSMDLLVRSLLSLGATRRDVGAMIGSRAVMPARGKSPRKQATKS